MRFSKKLLFLYERRWEPNFESNTLFFSLKASSMQSENEQFKLGNFSYIYIYISNIINTLFFRISYTNIYSEQRAKQLAYIFKLIASHLLY